MKNNHKLISLLITFLAAVLLLVSCAADTTTEPDAPTKPATQVDVVDPSTVVPEPDLDISFFTVNGSSRESVEVQTNAQITLAFQVRGEARISSSAGMVTFYRSGDNNIDTRDTPVGNADFVLGVGGTSPIVTSNFNVPMEEGTYYYGVCVGVQDNESNKANKCSGGIQVTVSELQSDLTIADFRVNGGRESVEALTNAQITLTTEVANRGRAKSVAGMLTFYRSDDNNIDTNDVPVGASISFGVIGAGGSLQTIGASPSAPSEVRTYYYGVCVAVQDNESNTDNNCSSAIPVTVSAITLGQAMDAPNYTFTSTGAANWFPQLDGADVNADNSFMSQRGSWAAQSGDITNGESSCMETRVVGPKNISFFWKIDSVSVFLGNNSPPNDPLVFYINRVEQSRISGREDWTKVSYTLTAGDKVLKWCFEKGNRTIVRFVDAAWVDNFQVTDP